LGRSSARRKGSGAGGFGTRAKWEKKFILLEGGNPECGGISKEENDPAGTRGEGTPVTKEPGKERNLAARGEDEGERPSGREEYAGREVASQGNTNAEKVNEFDGEDTQGKKGNV